MAKKRRGDSYKDQARQTAGGQNSRDREQMFFGASPTERKDLRETKDKKGIRLDDLDLHAADEREQPKIGENVRLIDMAMDVEAFAPDKRVQRQAKANERLRPEERGKRPTGQRPAPRPGQRAPGRPGQRPGRPARPGQRPQAGRPGQRPQPGRPGQRPPARPGQRPAPGRPGQRPGRPGQRPGPGRPGPRGPRRPRPR